MEYFFQNIKNNIDFFLRQHLSLSRKNYFEKPESKEGLFKTAETSDREKQLCEKYDLGYLKSHSTRQNYLENLYTIDLLDKHLKADFKEALSVLDIGCKNWFYAKAEHFFFKKYCNNLTLDGIEIDPNRLYTNLYSRKEVAKFHIKNLPNTNFIENNFLNHNEKYDFIIWILPFVVEYPHLKWGLPHKCFQPEKILLHAYNSLNTDNKNGKIFIINQGEVEYETQKSLCQKLEIPYIELGKIQSDFLNDEISRYALIIKN